METICAGGKIVTKDFVIDDDNRKSYFELFMALYRTERAYLDGRRRDGIRKSSEYGNYKGRSRIRINKMDLVNMFYEYEAGTISGREAAHKLEISPSTFYRRYREYQGR